MASWLANSSPPFIFIFSLNFLIRVCENFDENGGSNLLLSSGYQDLSDPYVHPLVLRVFLFFCDFRGYFHGIFDSSLWRYLDRVSWWDLVLGHVQQHLGCFPTESMHEHLEF